MSLSLKEFAHKLGIHPETLARRAKKGNYIHNYLIEY